MKELGRIAKGLNSIVYYHPEESSTHITNRTELTYIR